MISSHFLWAPLIQASEVQTYDPNFCTNSYQANVLTLAVWLYTMAKGLELALESDMSRIRMNILDL